MKNHRHAANTTFCKQALIEHSELFGSSPETFGYDRDANIKFEKKSGVKHIGIAPRGKRSSPVSEKMVELIRCAKAQVEGSIGTIKSSRYEYMAFARTAPIWYKMSIGIWKSSEEKSWIRSSRL